MSKISMLWYYNFQSYKKLLQEYMGRWSWLISLYQATLSRPFCLLWTASILYLSCCFTVNLLLTSVGSLLEEVILSYLCIFIPFCQKLTLCPQWKQVNCGTLQCTWLRAPGFAKDKHVVNQNTAFYTCCFAFYFCFGIQNPPNSIL